MLNIEKLMYELLTRSLADVDAELIPDLEVDSLEHFPVITFSVSTGNAVEGSTSPPGAWDSTLFLNVFDDDLDDAIALAGLVYDAVWAWDNPWSGASMIDGLGHVAEIDDQAIFSRVGTVAMGALSVTQLSGAFDMQAHQA